MFLVTRNQDGPFLRSLLTIPGPSSGLFLPFLRCTLCHHVQIMSISLSARRLYFVRHGHTDWNVRGLFQGHTDIPLNEEGERDAHGYAALLRDYFARHPETPAIARVIASPLARAARTARIVCEDLFPAGLVPNPSAIAHDARLMEQNYGLWEGRTLAEIREAFPGSVERQFASMRTFAADGGEPMPSLCARVAACVQELADNTLIVGHFGTLYALMLTLWPESPDNFPRITQDAFYIVEGTHIVRIDRDAPDGRPIRPARPIRQP